MFDIRYSNQAKKFLKNTDKNTAKRILEKIEKLRENPVIHDSKRILNRKEKIFRIRIGDYRVIYEVSYKDNLIKIYDIDKRSRVYRFYL